MSEEQVAWQSTCKHKQIDGYRCKDCGADVAELAWNGKISATPDTSSTRVQAAIMSADIRKWLQVADDYAYTNNDVIAYCLTNNVDWHIRHY